MLMEFVLSMPVLVMLIMLVVQFAQIWTVRQCVAYSAFCAARSILCASPVDSMNSDWRQNCAFHAARRVLAWVTIAGTQSSASLRHYDTGNIASGSSDYADISDTSTETFVSVIYGDLGTHDVMVPGWGQVPESNSVDLRLEVETEVYPRHYASAKVVYRYPLLIPVAGSMIGWLSRHSWRQSANVRNGGLSKGWLQSDSNADLIDGLPFIELTETCVLPLPYSPVRLPLNAYDYTAYD